MLLTLPATLVALSIPDATVMTGVRDTGGDLALLIGPHLVVTGEKPGLGRP